jgi:hypothetical protein
MMNTRSVFLRTATVAALALALAGCGMMGRGSGSNTETFGATLTGGEEVPPVTTSATGTAEATYDRTSNMLNYRVTYSGLSGPATAGHIHGPAGPGQNAPPVVPFANSGTSPITGQVRLTPEQYNQLSSGQWYVNIHTARNAGGEIRGQLRRR